MDAAAKKRSVQKKYLHIRSGMDILERTKKSERIAGHLYQMPEYKSCGELLIYLNAGSEAITEGIIEKAVSDGKTVAVPVITDAAAKTMVFVKILSTNNFVKNRHGILEPEYDAADEVKCGANSLIVAPGVCFTKTGGRIGFGGGYYDRYLTKNSYLCAAGLCFGAQLADSLPQEEHDVSMDYLITENGIIKCG